MDQDQNCPHTDYWTAVQYGQGHLLAWCADCAAQFRGHVDRPDEWTLIGEDEL